MSMRTLPGDGETQAKRGAIAALLHEGLKALSTAADLVPAVTSFARSSPCSIWACVSAPTTLAVSRAPAYTSGPSPASRARAQRAGYVKGTVPRATGIPASAVPASPFGKPERTVALARWSRSALIVSDH
jgi:hypothetical protein